MKQEYHKSTSEVIAHFTAKMLVMEKQAHEWKEVCRLIVHKGWEEDKYEAEVISLRTEMAVILREMLALRANSAVRSDSDVVLVATCPTG